MTATRYQQFVRRREIVQETIQAFSNPAYTKQYHSAAQQNVIRWKADRLRARKRDGHDSATPHVGRVVNADWGVVARAVTEEFGETFAVLNMANAYVPGGGYLEGYTAQEENMFRRTDCHFSLKPADVDSSTGRYVASMTSLLDAVPGRVYLDVEHPRVCVRGPEDRNHPSLGYAWLGREDVFPFYELRAAAQEIEFNEEEGRRRIAAQLDTLVDHGVRHAVLGAHGCGAFENPANVMARLYFEELTKRTSSFECVAFAILNSSRERDSVTPFREAFA